jgi:DinB superfamily
MTNEVAVKIVLDNWYSRVKATDEVLNKLTDEQLQHEISPGRNRGIYLLGHLTAVHDMMLPLLNFEPQLYPQLGEPFIKNPDKTVAELPSAKELRTYWNNVNAKLAAHINKLKPEEWFQKHNSVSAEDFAKEPHRNRLGIIASRTAHLASHQGQLVLIK